MGFSSLPSKKVKFDCKLVTVCLSDSASNIEVSMRMF